MKPQLPDDLLLDFVDGRLPEEERLRIEARLLEEPELARRVAAWQEIGRALREDPRPQLGPDFYVRARERFEREHGRRGPRAARGFSWELAGLAAAAALAGVLFVPLLWQGGSAPGPRSVLTAPQPAALDADTSTKKLNEAVAPETQAKERVIERRDARALAQAPAASTPARQRASPAPPPAPELEERAEEASAD